MSKSNNNPNVRTVFYISDRTCITAESLGNSLFTQFDKIQFKTVHLSFTSTLKKTKSATKQIEQVLIKSGNPALVFSTQVDKKLRKLIAQSNCIFFDFFSASISKMEKALNMKSSHTVGHSHGIMHNDENYYKRINNINFTINNDDGISKNYDDADVVIIGVSRSGKTPTCIFMALQYSIKASNYPLTEDNLNTIKLPEILKKHKNKLFGLTINPILLQKIRTQRVSNSNYASIQQCQKEIRCAEDMYQANNIPFIDTTHTSVEEITAKITDKFSLR